MDDIKLIVEEVKKRIENKYDFVAGITGEEGTGKSTFAIQFGFAFGKFNLRDNVVYLPKTSEVKDKFNSIENKSCLVVDEAIKALYKQNWREKVQAQINQLYSTERWQNKVTLLLMPRFTDFNEYFRNHRIKFWFHIIRRGIGVLFIKDDLNPFTPDPWYMKENFKLVYNFTKKYKNIYKVDVNELINYFETKIPNFVTSFTWEPLPEKVEEEYLTYKRQSREFEKEEEKSWDRDIVIYKMVKEKGIKVKDVSSIFNLSDVRIYKIIEEVESRIKS